MYTFFLYKQLYFQSQPGVANGFFQNEAESCLLVARHYQKSQAELLSIG